VTNNLGAAVGIEVRTPEPNTVRTPPVLVRDDLRALEGYHSAQVDVRVRLNTNESPVPPPQSWRDELADAVRSIEWHRYPDRSARVLRSSIGVLHGVSPEQVFVANGSNEVLQTLLLAYAGPGRTVLTFEPTYQLHGHIARITGAEVAEVDRDPDFAIDAGAAVEAVRRIRPVVTFLCSPNNPTGRVEPWEVVAAVASAAADVSGLLVVDEAYGQFADTSALGLVSDDANVVVTRTFSKTWSMAAARLGYLVGPSWLVAELDKVVLPYHLDAAKQLAGELALRHVGDMERRVAEVVAERERLVGAMSALGVDVFPSGANFVLFRPRGVAGRAVWQRLVDAGVLVRDCSSWPRLDDCLRVTIGTRAEDDEFLSALAGALVPMEVGR
jgi:histidinol-phosphate aminotransferase